MDNLNLEFMTLNGGFRMAMNPPSANTLQAFNELLLCFSEVIDGRVCLLPYIKMSCEIKANVTSYVDAYGESFPHLFKVRKKILDMPDGEYFLLMHKMPDETEERTKLEVFLQVVNECEEDDVVEEWQRRLAENNDFVGGLLQNYDIFNPRTDIRTTIGNATKDDRVCRFCDGTLLTGSTFSKVAHAVPEALGNKTLILADECDKCNEYFGSNIEPIFIGTLDIYRALLGVKGKTGLPSIKYIDGEIRHRDGTPVISAKKITVTENEVVVNFGGFRKFVPAKMYKALCKITLSAIEDEHLEGLEDTIRWVRNDSDEALLPKVALNIIKISDESPFSVTTFIRKNDNYSIPHVVSEFRFGSLVYVYILPFSRRDRSSFVEDLDFERYWGFFGIFNRVSGWTFRSYQSTKEFLVNDSIKLFIDGVAKDCGDIIVAPESDDAMNQ